MSVRLKWLWLATRRGVSARICHALLDAFGSPEQVYVAERHALVRVEGIRQAHVDALCDKALDEAEQIAETCEKQGISILTFADSGYPERLQNIPDAPLVLYVRGSLPDLDATPGISIVGTRKASLYGAATAEKLARELTEAGFVVVSGLAEGIDGAAARGALRGGGRTVAVMACGVDRCYPAMHRHLMGDILLAGAVISEYPPGEPPIASRFPVRNRIISGLSVGVLVVEAPRRSGALITAHTALDQGRDVFAVPGNLDAPNSAGTNRMIADGEAALICSAQDIIREYSGFLPLREKQAPRAVHRVQGKQLADRAEVWQTVTQHPVERQQVSVAAKPLESQPQPALSAEEAQLVQAVRAGADTVDAISEQTGVSAAAIATTLTMLELNGILAHRNGKIHLELHF